MTFPVQVGPSAITINRDDRFLVCQPDGRIAGGPDDGFFTRDTRFISAWEMRINGRRPVLLNSAPIQFFSARFEYTNDAFLDDAGLVDRHALGVRVDRTVSGGVHEDIDITSYARRPVRLTIEIAIESDFADIFDVRADALVRRGVVNTRFFRSRRELRTSYENGSFRRELIISVDKADAPPQYANGKLVFVARLPPKGTWHTCLRWLPITQSDSRRPVTLGCNAVEPSASDVPRLPKVTLETPNDTVRRAWQRAVGDMEALRLEDPTFERGVYIPAAGVPWYVTLFGRDTLVVSMQAISGYPEFASGALRRLGAMQADADDPERDMEPGKIPHEVRHGELAQLGILPYQPYYGTHDATSLYLVVYSYLYQWLGDVEVLRRYLPNAEAAMRWIDRYGDRDRDGFQEYRTRSSHGYYNQGWKDAGDAIPHADGTLAPLPLATCELQGYVWDAKLRMADVYEILGRPADARRLRREAKELYERFNDVFWWDAEGTYYLALDGAKKPVKSVASNAGHLLQSGIVPPERAGRVVERLLADDMWSGWGVRTLSSEHAAYNPFSYHTGSVWPHDNAMIAGGFRRHGFDAEAAKIAKGLFDVAERPGRVPPAGAVRGPAPARRELPGPVPRRERAAGLGGGLDPPADRDPVRGPRDDRRRRLAHLRQPGAARLAAGGDDPQPAGGPRLDRPRGPRRHDRSPREHERVRGDPRAGRRDPTRPTSAAPARSAKRSRPPKTATQASRENPTASPGEGTRRSS